MKFFYQKSISLTLMIDILLGLLEYDTSAYKLGCRRLFVSVSIDIRTIRRKS